MGAFNCNWEIWIKIFSDFKAEKSVLKVDLKKKQIRFQISLQHRKTEIQGGILRP